MKELYSEILKKNIGTKTRRKDANKSSEIRAKQHQEEIPTKNNATSKLEIIRLPQPKNLILRVYKWLEESKPETEFCIDCVDFPYSRECKCLN